jgi:uncharacterized protein (TIGR02646 family)
MRPIEKGAWPINESGQPKPYKPASTAKLDLETAIGSYCSYCEEFQSSLAVEHVISKDQNAKLAYEWPNFLLACSRCNGADNKWNRSVDLEAIDFPHLDNTFLSISYSTGGQVQANHKLEGTNAFEKATRLIELIGLNKSPGRPKHHPNDTRWKTRMERWEFINGIVSEYEKRPYSPQKIGALAAIIGHFSIWYTLFAAHPEVRKALIDAFKGTANDCFDAANNYQPIARSRA